MSARFTKNSITTGVLLVLVLLVSFLSPFTVRDIVHIEPSITQAQTTTGGTAATDPNGAADDLLKSSGLPACIDFGDFSLLGCAGQGAYWLLWWPTQWLASRSAAIMDYFIFFSLQDSTYRGTQFIEEGWKVVRDISNILLIFALVYIAIATILNTGSGGSSPKRLLVMVLVVGLLINFSLFFTRIVIDTGNILARILYQNIDLTSSTGVPLQDPQGVKSLGLMIIDIADPQAMIQSRTGEDAGVFPGDLNEQHAIFFLDDYLGFKYF